MFNIEPSSSSSESGSLENLTSIKSSINQTYQSSFMQLLFIKAYCKELKKLNLKTNVGTGIADFHDLVFYENEKSCYILLFDCFDLNDDDQIYDLLDEECLMLNLLKYVKACKEIKSKIDSKDLEIQKWIIITNEPLEFEKETFKEKKFDKNHLLAIQASNVGVKYFEVNIPNISKLLIDKVKGVHERNEFSNLTDKDIQDALKILTFGIVEGDAQRLQNCIEQQIRNKFKQKVPIYLFGNLYNLIQDSIEKNGIDELTYDDADLFIKRNVKIGILEGLDGSMYAVAVSMLLFTRAYFRTLENFVLESEVKEAAKFDDIVFSEDNQSFRFLQLKHKKDVFKQITDRDIFSDLKGDFNLLKYVCSYWIIKKSNMFNKVSIKDAIVFTNISMGSDNKMLLKPGGDVKNVTNNYKNWYSDLKEINLEEEIMTENDILEIKNFPVKYFKLTEPRIAEILFRQKETFKNSDIEKEIKMALKDLDLFRIQEALSNIIFAVCQPDEAFLFDLVKEELNKSFSLYKSDTIFNDLKENFVKWFQGHSVFLPQINFTIIKNFFHNHVKTFQLVAPSPPTHFVGRKYELETIEAKLNQGGIVGISGLGGVGKTALAKQYISKYKDVNYYGRVMWIEAESQTSIQNSFNQIFRDLKITQGPIEETGEIEEYKNKTSILANYFKDLKVIFVFNNVEEHSFKYLNYVKDIFSAHILFTTRNNQVSGNRVSLPYIILRTWTTDTAADYVQKSLPTLSNEDKKIVWEFVNMLHCFPLALNQAIAFIQTKNEQYTLKQYMIEYNTKEKELLDFKKENEYTDTTYMTMNIIMSEIQNDVNFGIDAIKILENIAYFHPDNIHPSICIPFVRDSDKIGRVLQLLKKYSMITESWNGERVYDLHRLVQKVTQIKNNRTGKETEILRELLSITVSNPNLWSIHHVHLNQILQYALHNDEVIKRHYESVFSEGWKMIHFAARFNICSALKVILYHNKYYDLNTATEDFRKITSLNIATQFNNMDFVKFLVENNVKLNVAGSNQTALNNAIANRNLEMVEYLVSSGFALDTVNKSKITALHVASFYGYIEIVEFLIGKNISVDAVNIFNETALHNACRKEKYEVIEFLVCKYSSLNAVDIDERTALHLACASGNLKIVNHLIQMKEIEINTVDKFGLTLLHVASESGCLEMVKILVKKDVPLNSIDMYGRTALHVALKMNNCNFELAKYLIDEGIELNVANKEGQTVLHLASRIQIGDIEIVKMLIDKEINLDAVDKKGNSALHLASRNNNIEVVELLVEKGISLKVVNNQCETALHVACLLNNPRVVQFLVKQDIALNAVDKLGQTALHVAVISGSFKIVECLVQKDITLDAIDKKNQTALHIAITLKNYEIVRFLVENGTNMGSVNGKSLLALHVAIPVNDFRIIKLLVQKRETLNFIDTKGQSALHIATNLNNLKIVKFLVKKKASLNTVNKNGQTVLYLAISRGNLEMVKIFVENNNALLYDVDKFGSTTLHVACLSGRIEIVQYLIEMGVNLNVTDKKGRTALDIATAGKKIGIVNYLIQRSTVVSVKHN